MSALCWDRSWSSELDAADPITRSHYRHMLRCTAGDPAPLVPGGVPCIQVTCLHLVWE